MPLAPLQPSGTASYRGAAARRLTECMHWLGSGFDRFGAEPVVPATLVSYQDAGSWLDMADDERLRFIDRRSGDVISLRADLTTQVLALAEPGQRAMYWAQGPVFRDSTMLAGARRERYHASFEILYDDPDFAISYSLLAACWIAARALQDRWVLVLGHTDQLEPLQSRMGGYSIPGISDWPASWRSAGTGEIPACLHAVHQSGLLLPQLRRNRTLPPSRSYYQGWFFRLYVPGGVEPVISGGQYRDPRTEGLIHAGFGLDIEQLAQTGRLPETRISLPETRSLLRADSELGRRCVELWDQGIRTRFAD